MNKEQEISKIQNSVADFVDITKNSKTTGEFMLELTRKFLGNDDPETKFLEFIKDNKENIEKAIKDFGIEIEKEEGFLFRLRKAWIKKYLENKQNE